MALALSIVAFVISIAAIGYAFLLFTDIMQKSDGDEKMQRIAKHVQDGARAFLMTEYKRKLKKENVQRMPRLRLFLQKR